LCLSSYTCILEQLLTLDQQVGSSTLSIRRRSPSHHMVRIQSTLPGQPVVLTQMPSLVAHRLKAITGHTKRFTKLGGMGRSPRWRSAFCSINISEPFNGNFQQLALWSGEPIEFVAEQIL
jgi:hypothetical protein